MPSPFPGMDPYLERPALWHDVHFSLVHAIRVSLVPQVAPDYYIGVEERTYVITLEPRTHVGRPLSGQPGGARRSAEAVGVDQARGHDVRLDRSSVEP